jgi:cell division protein ZapA
MKHIDVQIMGQSYVLGCPEGGEPQLREAVDRVDAAMCKIRDAGKVKARDRIAVLAALNLAFDIADRGATAPAGAPVNGVATNGHGANGATIDAGRLAGLIDRLDHALGDDGRLL